MSGAKFTGGEWTPFYPQELLNSGYVSVESDGGKLISIVEVHESDIVEKIANAHLIATSKKLYKTLQSIVDEAKDYQNRTGRIVSWVSDAEIVLAKARGKVV